MDYGVQDEHIYSWSFAYKKKYGKGLRIFIISLALDEQCIRLQSRSALPPSGIHILHRDPDSVGSGSMYFCQIQIHVFR